MRNRKDFYKNLATKLTSKTIKKCLGLLLILVLLVSNLGYAPNVYSSSKGSILINQPKLSPSLKTDGRTSVGSLTNKVNILGNSTNTEKYSKSENIYSGLENPSILNGQNLFSNQNDNNPNVVSSIYGSGPATTNELKIGVGGVGDESDLNLIDIESSVNPNQDIAVSGSVYKDVNQDSFKFGDSVAGKTKSSFPIQNKAGYYTVGFSRQTGSNLFKFSHKNANLVQTPVNPVSVSGKVYKNTISFEEIYPNTDLRYTVEPSRLKEEIVVKRYTDKNDFYFQLSVENAVYKVMSDNTIMFYDSTTNEPLFYIPRGFAIDNNGNRNDSLIYDLSQEGLLKVSVDPIWLQQAAYPIVIDPTINLFDATFTRTSVAYKQDGTQVTSGSPRYEIGKFNQGIMIEEGTSNLQTDKTINIYNNYGSADIETAKTILSETFMGQPITRINYTPRSVAGLNDIRSVYWNHGAMTSTPFTYSANTDYYATIYWRSSKTSVTVNGGPSNIGGWSLFTTTDMGNGWKRSYAKYNYTVTQSDYKFWAVMDPTINLNETITVDFVAPQLEQKPYATSFTEVTRSPESLTIPTAGVFTKGNWTVEMTFIPTSKQDGVFKYGALWDVYIDSQNVYRLLIHETGRPYLATTSGGIEYNTYDSAIPVMQVGIPYKIMVSGNGSVLTFSVNGVQYAVGRNYVEPLGLLPVSMGIGSGTITQANGIIDDFRVSNRARTTAEAQEAYQSNQPLPVDQFTTCQFNFDDNLNSHPTVNLYSTFSRSSVAYKQDGTQVASGSPRYEIGKFNQAITVEEGTSNLLTANQSSVETDLGGIYYWSQYGASLTRDTTISWQGSASTKLVSTYSGSQNMTLQFAAWGQRVPLSPNTIYSVSAKAKANVTGKIWYITAWFYDSAGTYLNVAASGPSSASQLNWITLTNTFTTPANTASAYVEIVLLNASYGDTLWYDGGQVEQKPYATSWQIGGTSRDGEIITIPKEILNEKEFTVEMRISPTANNYVANYWQRLLDLGNGFWLWNYVPVGTDVANRRIIADFGNDSSGNRQYLDLNGNQFTPSDFEGFAIVFTGTQFKFFRNGTIWGTYTPSRLNGFTQVKVDQANWLIDDLRISSRARTDQEIANAYNSNQQLPVDLNTTAKFDFNGSLKVQQTNLTPAFSRQSVAYKQDGTQVASGSPRYEIGKFNQGITIEEGTTNGLSSIYASDTALLNYFYPTAGTCSIEPVTPPVVNMKVIKHISYGIDSYLWAIDSANYSYTYTSSGKLAVTGGDSVTTSVWAKGNTGGEQIELFIFEYTTGSYINAWSQVFTLTNTWKRYDFTHVISANSLRAWTRFDNNLANQTIYWSSPQLEKKSYATSFTNSTRSPETLTIPTAGVFTKGNWTVELTYNPKLVQNTTQQILWYSQLDVNNRYVLWIENTKKLCARVFSNGVLYDIYDTVELVPGNSYTISLKGDGTTLSLFRNGTLAGSRNYIETSAPLPTSMSIGSDFNGVRQANGVIDDLRISSVARTDQEIANAYNTNVPLPVDANTTYKMEFDNSLIVTTYVPDSKYPTKYIYDASNRLDYVILPSGEIIDFEYDNNGNLLKRVKR